MNKVILIGILTDNPEKIDYRDSYGCELKLIVHQADFSQQAYPREPYHFSVNVWNRNADYALNGLQKGDLVSIEGHIKSELQVSQTGREYLRLSIVTERIRKIPLSFNKSGYRLLPNENRFNRMSSSSYSNYNNSYSNDESFEPPATTEIKGYRENHDIEDIQKIEPKDFAKFSTPSNFKPNHSLVDDEDEDDMMIDMDTWMNENK
ncbi:single-stranded DNA-binding protein [[Mycoplasma] imitans]|uniref:single-stranded DNA-binding protein n=1 Tax=[Mycoplasma] imitans TaxID=29560 RepID=UPI0004872B5F|nr:single-stranded DNA-binding protein [[Mycoplasma] imitans]